MTEPPIYRGTCPYCASAISTMTRDGITYARCAHRGCMARGPHMRNPERAVDLFTRGEWSVRVAPSVPRAPHAAHSDRVLADLRAMTPDQARQTLVDAGIYDQDGNLTEPYRE